jgi:hypothetical protein
MKHLRRNKRLFGQLNAWFSRASTASDDKADEQHLLAGYCLSGSFTA